VAQRLSPQEVSQVLAGLPGWRVEEDCLIRRFSFRDFRSAMDFANQVAQLAEEAGHHPDMTVGYGYVQVRLTTHDAGGITQRDVDLARKVEALPAGKTGPQA
jgi:4a-hydroxytetrahydrobiopterin dehydratase